MARAGAVPRARPALRRRRLRPALRRVPAPGRRLGRARADGGVDRRGGRALQRPRRPALAGGRAGPRPRGRRRPLVGAPRRPRPDRRRRPDPAGDLGRRPGARGRHPRRLGRPAWPPRRPSARPTWRTAGAHDATANNIVLLLLAGALVGWTVSLARRGRARAGPGAGRRGGSPRAGAAGPRHPRRRAPGARPGRAARPGGRWRGRRDRPAGRRAGAGAALARRRPAGGGRRATSTCARCWRRTPRRR